MKKGYWMCKVCYRRMPERFDNCYSCGKPRVEVDDLIYQAAIKKDEINEKARQEYLEKIKKEV